MQSSIKNFWIDTDYCLAHYLCVDLAPLFFEMSENGWAIGIRRTDCPDLKPEEVNDIIWAAAHCPIAAIKLELNTGETIDADSEFLRGLWADISPRLLSNPQ